MHVMLDLETLGTKPGCKILSISACTFGAKRKFQLDIFVKLDSQPLLMTDEDTYRWWMTHDEELIKFTFDNQHAQPLSTALYMFAEWYKALPGEPPIWGNGATFDCPVLRAAFEYLAIPVPWHYRKERCYRTLKAEFGHLVSEPTFKGIPHRSLHDARNQAQYAEMILNRIQG